MPYSEILIAPMREDLTRHGIAEARTPDALDKALTPSSGTVLVVTNSVCGCAAGKARPGVIVALKNTPHPPDATVSVFAGADVDAVAHLRDYYLPGVPPSSPSVALFRGGKPVYVMHRSEIESSDPITIAHRLLAAFETHGAKQPQ